MQFRFNCLHQGEYQARRLIAGVCAEDRSYIIGRKALRDALKEMPKKYQSLVIVSMLTRSV